ncbi:LacI family DNA-binding transcriptional regulator, partial [Novosphingobium sp. B-7]
MTDQDNGRVKRGQRRGARGPTVADVARLAQVSPMTVSRVVNSDPKVHEATRAKVEKAIAELGYVPNLAARSLAGGRQCRIGLLHSNPSSAYLSEFLVGSNEQANAMGAQLLVEHFEEEASREALAAKLLSHRVDAVLLPPPLSDDVLLLECINRAGLVMAQVATGAPSPLAHAVTIDDEAAAYALTARLTGLGHRRIGFIGGAPNQTASALRRNGYRRALAEAGIDGDRRLETTGDFTFRSGMDCALALLSLDEPPTAIFASNDDMAAATVAAAHRMGLDVPRQLSVCGFDDTASATNVWPELT